MAASDTVSLPCNSAIQVRARRVSRAREVHSRQDHEPLGVDVGLQEAIEQHDRIGTGVVEPQRHLAERAEVGAELNRDGHGNRGFDSLEDIEVTLLDVASRGLHTAREVVDVQLDRGGAGVLHGTGIVGPTLRGDAVEARDHGNLDRGHRAFEQRQVGVRAAVLLGNGGKVTERLGEALGAVFDETDRPRGLLP